MRSNGLPSTGAAIDSGAVWGNIFLLKHKPGFSYKKTRSGQQLPIPPFNKLVGLSPLFDIQQKVKDAGIEVLGIGYCVGSGKNGC